MTEIDLLNYCKNYKTIYCYGAGKYGRLVRAFLKQNAIELKAFIVSDHNVKMDVLSVPVLSISSLEIDKDSGILIGVGKKYVPDILDELERKDVHDYFIISEQIKNKIESELTYDDTYSFKNNVCCLYYHRVNNIEPDIWKLSITPPLFEEHMKYLSSSFKMIGIAEMEEDISKPSIVVTFDDGYADNFENALPILEKYKIPATIFVSTGNLDTDKEFWWDKLERIICKNDKLPSFIEWKGNKYRTDNAENKIATCYEIHPILKKMGHNIREKEIGKMAEKYGVKLSGHVENRSLNKDELKQLASSEYITIGAHTVTHSCLYNQSKEEQFNEIMSSKRTLEEIIDKPIRYFSFPFGGENDFSEVTLSLLKSCELNMAFSTFPGTVGEHVDNLRIPRNWVCNEMNGYDLKQMIMKTFLMHG